MRRAGPLNLVQQGFRAQSVRPGIGREKPSMRKTLLSIALIFATVSVASINAAAEPISPATANTLCRGNWTNQPTRICTWCGKGLAGVARCHLIGCRGTRCEYLALSRGGATRAARISLSKCIGNYDRCRFNCTNYAVVLGYEWKQCLNRCDANHAVCVDAAMDLSPGR